MAGLAGVAVAAAAVVMAAGLEAMLVPTKENGPPAAPTVIFCTAMDAGKGVLAKPQVITADEITLAAGMVKVLPAIVPKLAGLPLTDALESLHDPDVRVHAELASVT